MSHYDGLDEAQEANWIASRIETLRKATGQPVKGRLSPARSRSMKIMDLIAAQDIDYACDWINDEMPYPIATKNGACSLLRKF